MHTLGWSTLPRQAPPAYPEECRRRSVGPSILKAKIVAHSDLPATITFEQHAVMCMHTILKAAREGCPSLGHFECHEQNNDLVPADAQLLWNSGMVHVGTLAGTPMIQGDQGAEGERNSCSQLSSALSSSSTPASYHEPREKLTQSLSARVKK
jgi:hypothetical protein